MARNYRFGHHHIFLFACKIYISTTFYIISFALQDFLFTFATQNEKKQKYNYEIPIFHKLTLICNGSLHAIIR